MTFRTRQIDVTADGRRIARDRDLDQPTLTIGRAAESDIHLPDLAVEPRAARIAGLDRGRIAVEAAGTLGFIADGTVTKAVTIDCRSGAELRFGSSRIAASLDADAAVLLTIERIASEAVDGDDKRSFALASVLPSRRLIAWLAVLAILGLFAVGAISGKHARSRDAQTTKIAGPHKSFKQE